MISQVVLSLSCGSAMMSFRTAIKTPQPIHTNTDRGGQLYKNKKRSVREASLFWNRLSDAAPTVSGCNWFHRLTTLGKKECW